MTGGKVTDKRPKPRRLEHTCGSRIIWTGRHFGSLHFHSRFDMNFMNDFSSSVNKEQPAVEPPNVSTSFHFKFTVVVTRSWS